VFPAVPQLPHHIKDLKIVTGDQHQIGFFDQWAGHLAEDGHGSRDHQQREKQDAEDDSGLSSLIH
jgi:hypothetical protein